MSVVATASLTKVHLPRPYARWDAISRFALTFDIAGESVGVDFLSAKNTFDPEETDPVKIRRFLFLTQRIQNHQHIEPTSEEMKVIWAAVERLRSIIPA
jgi:hypothetical protein